MSNLFEKSVNFGLGLFAYSKEKVETMVDEMVKKGEINKGDAQSFVSELMEKGERQKQELKTLIKESIKENLDLNTVTDKEEIRKIVREEILKIQEEQKENK